VLDANKERHQIIPGDLWWHLGQCPRLIVRVVRHNVVGMQRRVGYRENRNGNEG
jgi:hypothetical protein